MNAISRRLAAGRYKFIHLVDRNVLEGFFGNRVNYYNSVVVTINERSINYIAISQAGKLHPRDSIAVDYLHHLLDNFNGADRLQRLGASVRFLFQGDDCPADYRSASWQTREGFEKISLVPDFYYVSRQGYRDFHPDEPTSWDNREAKIFWRGATTGGWRLTRTSVENISRFKLCALAAELGERADCGFYSVTQAASPESKTEIEDFLRAQGLLKDYFPLHDYVRYRYFVQIDGNGNSWDLVAKLRLGCCMLLVDSPWKLWHKKLLRPWEHYVPVANDLSDLLERVSWCQANEREASEIAARGRALALSIDYGEEMSEAIDVLMEAVDLL